MATQLLSFVEDELTVEQLEVEPHLKMLERH